MNKLFVQGGVICNIYHWLHPNVPVEKSPYYYKCSVLGEIWHLIRQGICQNIAPNCILNPVRIALYRSCGIKIGKNVFIGFFKLPWYQQSDCGDNGNITVAFVGR